MELCIIGFNHRTTPLEFREQLSVAGELVPSLLEELKSHAGIGEAVVLSTCNRLELYTVSSDHPADPDKVFESLWRLKGCDADSVSLQRLRSFSYVHRGQDCVQHLFRVASSLDSLVVGETEIVGQVKKAYQLAQSCGATGKVLNRLFQKALSISKEVRTRSGIGRCSTSVGSVALDLATKIFGEDLSKRTILIIGAGKMGETTLKHLTKHGAKSVLVANRSYDRALELVGQFQGEAVPFDELASAVARADVVVSSTSAPHYVLGKTEVGRAMAQRPDRSMLLIDLAVPRDIDPATLELGSVYLYNIDQLAELAHLNMERRQSEAAACEVLVARHAQTAAAGVLGQRSSGEGWSQSRRPAVIPGLSASPLAMA